MDDKVWDAVVKWYWARQRFLRRATYETTHVYCDAVEALEKVVREAGPLGAETGYVCPLCREADAAGCQHPVCPNG